MNNEITINGEIYVKKESVSDKDYCIIRTYSAGVFAGYIESREGKEAVIVNSRRLWSWAGARSLSQLAVEGTKKQEECNFAMIVDKTILTEVIEIIPCTPEAKKSIESVKIWKI
jgi:hypothetical protein